MGPAVTTFILGLVAGLLLVPGWRLVRDLREARRDAYLDIHSKERLEMLTKNGDL